VGFAYHHTAAFALAVEGSHSEVVAAVRKLVDELARSDL
jgi:hypothetical protein